MNPVTRTALVRWIEGYELTEEECALIEDVSHEEEAVVRHEIEALGLAKKCALCGKRKKRGDGPFCGPCAVKAAGCAGCGAPTAEAYCADCTRELVKAMKARPAPEWLR